MSEYTKFPIDFINRTRYNLEGYSREYEITNLINCCLGLIIIPKQKLHDRLPKYVFDNVDSKFGITKRNITYEENDDYEIHNILRHIRNGLAHGRIDQKTERGEIIGLRIHDKRTENGGENFAMEFSVQEFKNFAVSVSDLFIRH